jgi:2',3'-cyclic-nucleotide 2'-phosphodiesterase (5'-nucleotidase family)
MVGLSSPALKPRFELARPAFYGYARVVLLALLATACRRPSSSAPRSSSDPPPTTPPTGAPPRGHDIAVVYSSNILATIGPCDCVDPLGGLARRATVIAQTRATANATIVADAGDLLTAADDRKPGPSRHRPDVRRARLVALAVGRAGIDAFTPGERDLALPLPALRAIAREAALPIVSANLTDTSGKPLFDPDRLISAAGVEVGLFGVTAPPSPADAIRWRAAGIAATDPVDAARQAVRSLRARGAQVVIALVHVGTPDENRRLVAAVPGVDWAVLGHSGLNLESPEPAGEARLIEAMAEGRNLGRLDLHVVDGRPRFADAAARADLEATIADHRRQLEGYDRTLGDADPAPLANYRATRRQQIQQAIAREAAALAALPARITGSWFENRIIPLDATVPEDPGVAALVAGADTIRTAPATGGARARRHGTLAGRPPGHL